MKLVIIGVLALSLILTNAAVVDPLEEGINTLRQFTESLNAKSNEVSRRLQNKYDEIIAQPQERVQASVAAIEERKQENEVCVDQQWTHVENVVQVMENSLDTCTQTASTTSASLAIDIVKITVDLAYDIYNLVRSIQKCSDYKNALLKSTCYANQVIKVNKIVLKTRKAIKAINESADETLPQILVELEACSAAAEESALARLEEIDRTIDSCVAL